MFPRHYRLEQAAEVVWKAAKKGRQNAREGFRISAFAYMAGLSEVARSDGPESLRRIARDAAWDINRLLNGDSISLPHGGGSAA